MGFFPPSPLSISPASSSSSSSSSPSLTSDKENEFLRRGVDPTKIFISCRNPGEVFSFETITNLHFRDNSTTSQRILGDL